MPKPRAPLFAARCLWGSAQPVPLAGEAAGPSSLEIFKTRLDKILCSLL